MSPQNVTYAYHTHAYKLQSNLGPTYKNFYVKIWPFEPVW